ncbi:MAG: SDR family oxidoreductase [Oscillospiraceae bacterium]|nr:SDR family oxidoreductase [Oscillospiraceae bacterium]
MELLKDMVAVVTGGTRGIGYAIVKTFLENKAKVILCGSRPETAQKAVDQLKAENAAYEVEGISPDLTSYSDIEKALSDIKAKYGKIDILVNNAGISASDPLYNYDPKDFDKILQLNVNACFYTSRAVAPIMKENGGGVILNTSSMVSIYGQPAGVGYPTSKFAVNGMTKSLARELAKDQIRVNAVAPGVTDTDMVAALPEQTRQYITSTIPLGRIGTPQDIANAFLFLASPLASYITGVILSVDGCART